MMDFKEYLLSQKTSVVDNDPIHVVVGNRAGDADSIISALTLAYIDTVYDGVVGSNNKNKKDDHDNANSNTNKKIPIVSITQKDLQTQRPEVSFLFRTLGLDDEVIQSLRYIDDPIITTTSAATAKQRCLLSLVDHNRMEDAFQISSSNSWQVVEILDHHMDEQQHLDTCPPPSNNDNDDDAGNQQQRLIAFENDKATVASTCTLIAERLKALHGHNTNTNPHTQQQATQNKYYHPTLSTLLLGTILLDSVNMIPAAGKGTPRDANAIQDLLDNTDWSTIPSEARNVWFDDNNTPRPPKPNTTLIFESLQAAKFDPDFWNSLSVQDALRLDYKSFTATSTNTSAKKTFGASAILMPMKEFLQKPHLMKEIYQYMVEIASVDFLAILFFSTTPEQRRQRHLILCGTTPTKKGSDDDDDDGKLVVVEEIAKFLQKDGTLNLEELEKEEALMKRGGAEESNDGVCSHGGGGGDDDDKPDMLLLTMKFYNQLNVKASRKQVAPLLIQFFES